VPESHSEAPQATVSEGLAQGLEMGYENFTFESFVNICPK